MELFFNLKDPRSPRIEVARHVLKCEKWSFWPKKKMAIS